MNAISKHGTKHELVRELEQLIWRVETLGHKDELTLEELKIILERVKGLR